MRTAYPAQAIFSLPPRFGPPPQISTHSWVINMHIKPLLSGLETCLALPTCMCAVNWTTWHKIGSCQNGALFGAYNIKTHLLQRVQHSYVTSSMVRKELLPIDIDWVA
jgi:hypothetical protein